ncbi:MAG: helix-turn-helix transcriptional regulator [Treponema sp.]
MNTVSLVENEPAAEKTMTVKDVAHILGVTERTIQRHLKSIREKRMSQKLVTFSTSPRV